MASEDHLAASAPGGDGQRTPTEALCATNPPIHLYTPTNLVWKGTQSISSPSPITINGVTIWSSAPIHILGGPQGQHLLISTTLSPNFARGWSRLSDELKLRILSYNLVEDRPVGIMDRALGSIFMQHLRMTPEIATLSRDIFYKMNTFELRPRSASIRRVVSPAVFDFPKPAVNAHIRKVQFIVRLRGGEWHFLRRFANGSYGFPNLQELHVYIDQRCEYVLRGDWDRFVQHSVGTGLEFSCSGNLQVLRPQKIRLRGTTVQSDEIERVLKEKVIFKGNVEK
ncbi:hypothetical protein BU26DRAFT_319100 [Trematosphaeria pertusa]|uniref:Uncharacterized protein n=1 Tax=Trematosphaeria pertusa TaxID=390896 RepID=A0A6A6IHZ0_9PLEO|nr:uncharacterized protein BU26DRAFT_319100 [Trematosphaeria pertusa]KAF2249522.1 hypothetical protein BU26DRAFT_319100 [Trematosphaeria pertusa]